MAEGGEEFDMDPVDNQDDYDYDDDDEQDTNLDTFDTVVIEPNPDVTYEDLARLRIALNRDYLDPFYDHFNRDDKPLLPQYQHFDREENGLFYKTYKGKVRLTDLRNPNKCVELSGIEANANKLKLKGRDFIRKELGFKEYTRTTLNAKQSQTLAGIQPETIEMEQLPKAVGEINDIVQEVVRDDSTQTEGLNYRELVALDERLQTMGGEHEEKFSASR